MLDSESQLGPFWGIPASGGFTLAGFPHPFAETPDVAGFRTVETAHAELWPTLTRSRPELRGRDYEYFPRGRVSWRAEDAVFLVGLDRLLFTRAFTSTLLREWRLPSERTNFMLDSHYRCRYRPG